MSIFRLSCLSFIFFFYCLSANSSEQAQQQFVVGFAQDTMANDWRAAQVRHIENAFKKYPNVKFIFTDGKGRSAKQIQDLEDLVLQGVDLVMTSPRDSIAMTPVISRIYKSGVPVVLVTRKIENGAYTTFVAPSDEEIARNAAIFMAKKLKGEGNILMLKGVPTATTAVARTEGFLKEIKKYPGIKVVAIKDGNYLRSDAIRVTTEAIKENVTFDAIYAQSDSMASGARLALKKAGIDPARIVTVGIDYITEAREAIRKGLQAASFMYPTCAVESVQVVMDILNKKHVPRSVQVSSKLITKNNVEIISPIF